MNATVAQRNLLFGLLAQQTNFVGGDDLIAAAEVWLRDKSQPLDQILLQRGALSAEDHALLAALVERHLRRHGGDPQASLTALSSVDARVHNRLVGLGDAEIEATMTLVRTKGDDSSPDVPTVTTSARRSPDAAVRFRIVRPHARGGLGEVFVARDEELNREVALKEIQARHADDAESRTRFLLEAEITGGLEHPGIVPVYGLGQYADGRPFYAMRFIRGDSLREATARFHAENTAPDRFMSLEFRKLLGRFVDVCNAMAYAHSRGVLHRDLKPGNIMLGKYGETLLVDWGLAKPADRSDRIESADESLLQPRSGSGVVMTQMGSVVGTPTYMSPEQAAGRHDELGPPSDVYSLGATLHYLLTCQPPVRGNDVGEVLNRVQKGEITAPRDLDPAVPKALDAVCRKALAHRPGDRYPSPRELGDEIERYLADEAVRAFREPVSVRLRRWARKHPAVVSGTAAAAAVVLLALATIASLQASHRRTLSAKNKELATSNEKLVRSNEAERRARQEAERQTKIAQEARQEAEQQAKIAQTVNDFLQQDMIRQTDVFAQADRKQQVDPDLTLREALDRAADRIGDRFQEEPLVEAAIRLAIGDAYRGVGEAEKAIEHLERSVEIQCERLGLEHPDTLTGMDHLAGAYQLAGRLDEAIQLYEETLQRTERTLGPEHPDTLATVRNLATAYRAAGRFDEAIRLLEKTLKLCKARLGPEHPATLTTMNNLAAASMEGGRLEEALRLHEATLQLMKAKLGLQHPNTLASMSNLGTAYVNAGRLDQAMPLLQKTLELMKTKLGPQHPSTLTTMNNLGRAYNVAGRFDQAVPLLEETLKLTRAKLGSEHPHRLSTMNNLAQAYSGAGRLDEAVSLYEETLKLQKDELGPDHPGTLSTMHNLAAAYVNVGRLKKAIRLCEETLKLRRAKLGPDHPSTLATMHNLAAAYFADDRRDEALRLLEEALKLHQAKLGPEHPKTLTTMSNLAAVYEKSGNHSQAAGLYKEMLRVMRKQTLPGSPELSSLLATIGDRLIACEAYADAESILRECYDLRRKSAPGAWTTFNAEVLLGAALAGQAETQLKADAPDQNATERLFAEAEKHLLAGYHGLKKTKETIPNEGKINIERAREKLVRLYTAWGQPEEAAKWKADEEPDATHRM